MFLQSSHSKIVSYKSAETCRLLASTAQVMTGVKHVWAHHWNNHAYFRCNQIIYCFLEWLRCDCSNFMLDANLKTPKKCLKPNTLKLI